MSEVKIVALDQDNVRLLPPLFAGVFGKKVSAEWLRAKYAVDFTAAETIGALAMENGKAVGFFCLLPQLFIRDGKRILAAQSVDTMLHPSLRGRGIFRELEAICVERARAAGVQFLYGYPVEQVVGKFCRLGWSPLFRMQMLSGAGAERPLQRLGRRLGLGGRWEGGQVPEEVIDRPAVKALAHLRGREYYGWRSGCTEAQWREFSGGWAWLRPGTDLWVGDVEPKGEFGTLWAELEAFAGKKGFPRLIFQASPTAWERLGPPREWELTDTWQVLGKPLGHDPGMARMDTVFADGDAF